MQSDFSISQVFEYIRSLKF